MEKPKILKSIRIRSSLIPHSPGKRKCRTMKRGGPCDLSPTKWCEFGGNKRYGYGFLSGMAGYCRKSKTFTSDLKECPKNVVNVCAWCPDKEERTKRAEIEGNAVSHGMCPECSEKYDWK